MHQLCEPLKNHSHCLASKAEKLKAAHGLQLFVKLLTEEVATQQTRGGKGGLPESLLKQLPYITWYLTMTLSKVMSKDIRARGGYHSLAKEENVGDLLVFSLMATQSIQKLVEMVCVTMRNGRISTAIVKLILVPLTNNLLECIQVWPLTQFFFYFLCVKKIIDLLGGQNNDPSSGKCYSLLFLPATPLSPSRTLEGLFELTL